jgi:hypothetical protein
VGEHLTPCTLNLNLNLDLDLSTQSRSPYFSRCCFLARATQLSGLIRSGSVSSFCATCAMSLGFHLAIWTLGIGPHLIESVFVTTQVDRLKTEGF